ncbi:response regulator [Falsihalocynthiibacter sp. SS001]|uniref:response regulator transcription factor n=1 Tax=Falsihalocynthiibacter sp. SS001 TaxID=3349698 RepID=UPI0036D3305C
MSLLRVLVADDHKMVLDMISSLLASEEDIEVDVAQDFTAAIQKLNSGRPYDVTLLDFNMPGMVGIDGLRAALGESQGKPVAIMSGVATKENALEAISTGAAGFIPKTMHAKSLVSAVRFMAAGEVFVPNVFLDASQDETKEHPLAKDLSRREFEVLEGVCRGLANKEIARELDLREVTVKLHMKNLCRKVGANNRTHAAMIARDAGLF